MLCNMEGTNLKRKTYVRTGPESREALARVKAVFTRYDVTQEDLVAATWLWMATIDAEELREKVRPFIERARADGIETADNGQRQPRVGKVIDRRPKRDRTG